MGNHRPLGFELIDPGQCFFKAGVGFVAVVHRQSADNPEVEAVERGFGVV